MIFRHPGLEAGGSDLFRATLLGAPFDKDAVGDAAKHSQDPYSISARPLLISRVRAWVEAG
jgi:hypothetical protein